MEINEGYFPIPHRLPHYILNPGNKKKRSIYICGHIFSCIATGKRSDGVDIKQMLLLI